MARETEAHSARPKIPAKKFLAKFIRLNLLGNSYNTSLPKVFSNAILRKKIANYDGRWGNLCRIEPGHYFLREEFVGGRSAAVFVVVDDGFAMAGRFGEFCGARDGGLKNFCAEQVT